MAITIKLPGSTLRVIRAAPAARQLVDLGHGSPTGLAFLGLGLGAGLQEWQQLGGQVVAHLWVADHLGQHGYILQTPTTPRRLLMAL